MAKKPNPQDSTRRNVQAANKRIAALTLRVKKLEAQMAGGPLPVFRKPR